MIRHRNSLLALALALTCATTPLFAQNPAPPAEAPRYKLGVEYVSRPFSLNEQFEFAMGGERVVLRASQRVGYFSRSFTTGETYQVSQVSGPRSCNYLTEGQGVMGSADVVLKVHCYFPPTTRIRGAFTGIAAGETFTFTDPYQSTLSMPLSGTAPLGLMPQGDTVRFTQVSGPRQCRITPASFVVTPTPLTLDVKCGVAQTFKVNGTLSAKPGTRVVLSLNGAGDLPVVARVSGTSTFTQTPFSFTAPVADGAPYSVTIKTPPAGTRCFVSAGTGTINGAAPSARVVCGLEWDLATRSTDDKSFATYYETASPSIGGLGTDDGRYVAFTAVATGFAGSTGSKRQVFWRDRETGVTVLISRGIGGVEGNGDSVEPIISADGRSVAFESEATDLVPIDKNGVKDVFVWNADTKVVTAVSDAPGNIEANSVSSQPSISGDGRLVAFTSSASNLTPGVLGNAAVNVFLKDMQSGSVTLLSVDEKTGKAGSGSRPSISDDGSRVAFHSANALRADDRNGLWDIYVWDRNSPALRRISKTTAGQERQQGEESATRVVTPTISGDGRFVAFSTTAANMTDAATKQQLAFVADVESGSVKLVSATPTGETANGDSPVGQGERIGISRDGGFVVFTNNALNLGGSVIVKNVNTGATRVIKESGARIGRADISRDGTFIMVGVGEALDKRFSSSGLFVTYR